MLEILENISLRPKTTLKIGGNARWYAELKTKEDCEEAAAFSQEKQCPLIVLGGGSNTIFADGTVEALVVRTKAEEVKVNGNRVTVKAGKNLANLINELAENNLDLSPLTGIPGSIGGAVFGNAGQGFDGTWIDQYVVEVEVFAEGTWKTLTKEELEFGYRTSAFKKMRSPIIWSTTINVPSGKKEEIQEEIEKLLQKRIETQPHVKTAGSCFLSVSKDQPAWKLIDEAGLRGKKIGGITVSPKHANFLINEGEATFEDTKKLIQEINEVVGALRHGSGQAPHSEGPLQVEMRLVEESGDVAF